jgi:tetratricopeptide (TPR) repeat protein
MRALSILCDIAGDYVSARRAAEEAAALYTQLSDARGVADSKTVLAGLAQEAGELDEAKSEFRLVREIYEELDDKRGVAVAIGSLGNIALLEQSYDEAVMLAAESMRLYDTLADKEGVIHTLIPEGFADHGRDSAEEAARAFRSALSLSMMLSHKEGVAVALKGLAGVAVTLEMVDETARLLGRGQALRDEDGLSRQALEDHFYQSTLAVLRDRMTMDRLQGTNESRETNGRRVSKRAGSNRPGE